MRQLKETRQRLISVSNLFICRGEQQGGVVFLTRQPYYGLKQPQISLGGLPNKTFCWLFL